MILDFYIFVDFSCRIAAIAMIVICRMQYLVRRWRYGRLIGGNTVLGRAYSESIISSASYHGKNFGNCTVGYFFLGIINMLKQNVLQNIVT